jgi:TubC N-terminal docking domain
MTMPPALDLARRHGLTITLDGDRLKYRAPHQPPADVLAALKQNKPAIISYLKAIAERKLDQSESAPEEEPPPRCNQCRQTGDVQQIAIEGRVVPLHVACLGAYEQALNRELAPEPPRANPGNELMLTEIRPRSEHANVTYAIPYGITCAQCGERDAKLRPYRHDGAGDCEPWIWLHRECAPHYAREHRGG